ncbi:MAG: 8-oxo-(d)GTP phosphatase [Nocardioidaceae bacterium]|jgi:8-oxo-dGTP pyrophosphatase MutT (NUDIX family)/phosphohistidine phosphatase SixA|nr:8-oxo-(d)GTP phosphatase [Nocardioidaceae bacterium]MDX6309917.1 8-oxo-(d)GTP phosphatase [Nocardioidaceae bacterium]
MMSTNPLPTVKAAGCLVWRHGSDEPEVVVVHRPRWDDWSFPKGKLDAGETTIEAAAREVAEETGLRVRLGPRLHDDHYTISSGQQKVVSYWVAKPPPDANLARFEPNSEIDDVRWMPVSQAREQLSYPRDVELLDELTVTAFESSVLLVVRHAEARKRRTWRGDDTERPLAAEGMRTAARLVPVLAAYGVTRVVTSSSARCVDTMLPYANAFGVKVRLMPGLSEEKVSDKVLARLANKALHSRKRIAICTHRPVLPRLCSALGITDTPLAPGGLLVLHRAAGKVLSVEKPEGADQPE